jgi:hypothetical protein
MPLAQRLSSHDRASNQKLGAKGKKNERISRGPVKKKKRGLAFPMSLLYNKEAKDGFLLSKVASYFV